MKKIVAAFALLIGVNFVYAGDDTINLGGLKSKVPAGWTMQKPNNTLRKFQAAVAKAAGDSEDAELAIFNFGGSGIEDNLKRWKMQFLPPEGKSIDDVSKLEKYKVGSVEVVCLDIAGTFKYRFPPNDPKAKEQLKKDYRRFNVMFITESDLYFITLTGPAKTMEKHKAAFDGWLKGFK